MRFSSLCAIPARALIRRISSAFSKLSTPRNPTGQGWACRSAVRSSLPMEAAYGPMGVHLAARYFGSPCPPDSRILLGRLAGPERRPEALQQTRLVNGLSKVADDPIVECAGPVGVVGVGSDEDRRNRVSRLAEVAVEV